MQKAGLLKVVTGAFLCATSAMASSTSSGTIVAPIPVNNGLIYFQHNGSRTTPPACATDPRWIIDTSTTGGLNMYAGLLSAAMAGQKITVYGTGTCNGTTSETVAYFSIDILP